MNRRLGHLILILAITALTTLIAAGCGGNADYPGPQTQTELATPLQPAQTKSDPTTGSTSLKPPPLPTGQAMAQPQETKAAPRNDETTESAPDPIDHGAIAEILILPENQEVTLQTGEYVTLAIDQVLYEDGATGLAPAWLTDELRVLDINNGVVVKTAHLTYRAIAPGWTPMDIAYAGKESANYLRTSVTITVVPNDVVTVPGTDMKPAWVYIEPLGLPIPLGPTEQVQLKVIATLENGATLDVTKETQFQPESGIFTVTPDGVLSRTPEASFEDQGHWDLHIEVAGMTTRKRVKFKPDSDPPLRVRPGCLYQSPHGTGDYKANQLRLGLRYTSYIAAISRALGSDFVSTEYMHAAQEEDAMTVIEFPCETQVDVDQAYMRARALSQVTTVEHAPYFPSPQDIIDTGVAALRIHDIAPLGPTTSTLVIEIGLTDGRTYDIPSHRLPGLTITSSDSTVVLVNNDNTVTINRPGPTRLRLTLQGHDASKEITIPVLPIDRECNLWKGGIQIEGHSPYELWSPNQVSIKLRRGHTVFDAHQIAQSLGATVTGSEPSTNRHVLTLNHPFQCADPSNTSRPSDHEINYHFEQFKVLSDDDRVFYWTNQTGRVDLTSGSREGVPLEAYDTIEEAADNMIGSMGHRATGCTTQTVGVTVVRDQIIMTMNAEVIRTENEYLSADGREESQLPTSYHYAMAVAADNDATILAEQSGLYLLQGNCLPLDQAQRWALKTLNSRYLAGGHLHILGT